MGFISKYIPPLVEAYFDIYFRTKEFGVAIHFLKERGFLVLPKLNSA